MRPCASPSPTLCAALGFFGSAGLALSPLGCSREATGHRGRDLVRETVLFHSSGLKLELVLYVALGWGTMFSGWSGRERGGARETDLFVYDGIEWTRVICDCRLSAWAVWSDPRVSRYIIH